MCKARVMWRSNYFIGVKFDKLLTEAEMKYLLGAFAQKVSSERAKAQALGQNFIPPAYDAAALKQALLSSDWGEDALDDTPSPDPDLAA